MSAEPDVLHAAAQGRLRSLVERIERLEEDKAAIAAIVMSDRQFWQLSQVITGCAAIMVRDRHLSQSR